MKDPRSVGVAVALLAIGIAGCGGADRAARSENSTSKSAQNTPSVKLGGVTPAYAEARRRAELARVEWVKTTPQAPLPNDGDHDEAGDEDHDNGRDTGTRSNPGSVDPYLDYLPPADNTAYHDEDDEQAVRFGHPASALEARTVSASVKRYYLAAAAGDGERGCSMLDASLAKAVPLEYGKLGASYLRGGNTCAEVITRLFRHFHRELSAPVHVTSVSVSGATALAFFGSRSMRASDIGLHRVLGTWRVSSALGSTLP